MTTRSHLLMWVRRRAGKVDIKEAVNAVINSPDFPGNTEILVLISRDGGGSWSDWKADVDN